MRESEANEMTINKKISKIIYVCKEAPNLDWRLMATMIYSDSDDCINFIAEHCKELE